MKKAYLSSLAAGLLVALAFLGGCAGAPAAKVAVSEPAAAAQGAPAAEAPKPAGPKVDGVPLDLAIFHINDSHAKLEAAYSEFRIDLDDSLKGKRTFAVLGGFPRLWSAVDQLRAQNPNSLFLDAGDVFQGSLFFTQFAGMADLDFLNAMKLDAMVLGNHEFDKGTDTLVNFMKASKFPVLACNVDASASPAFAALLKPWVIKTVGAGRIGIIGLANPDTPYISSPGPDVKFLDPLSSVSKALSELTAQGVDKIIVLSHMGYDADLALAAKARDVDVIVGGHSHSLLGEDADLGLKTSGSYPTVVKGADGNPVLVVTAWQWAQAIGVLNLSFDAKGNVTKWSGQPKFVAGTDKFRIYDLPDENGKNQRVEFTRTAAGSYQAKMNNGKAYAADPGAKTEASYLSTLDKLMGRFASDPRFIFVDEKSEGVAMLKTYSSAVDALKKKIAGVAAEDLKRLNDQGPGPLIADGMRWKTGAQIAMMNPGGVRVDLSAGDLSVAKIYELQPFANTLVTMNVTGDQLLKIFDDMTDFCISSYGKNVNTAYAYVSGVKFTLMVNAPKGSRVLNVQVENKDGSWAALDAAATYSLVVNNFMAGGGDKNFTMAGLADKYDTGFIDSEAMLDYVANQKEGLKNITESRIKNVM